MGATSTGRRSIKSSSKSPVKLWKEAISFFRTALKACAKNKDLYQGSKIDADIRSSGLLEKDTYLGNMLVNMYAKCGALVRAQQVVDELPVRDVVSWTALISGYVQHGKGNEAVGCFHRMRSEGHNPNAITYACILKACGIIQDIGMGKQIHDEIASQGLLGRNVVLGSALVDMYAKCGAFKKAHKVFDELSVRDIISWTALIASYVQHGHGKAAIGCFHRMQSEGFFPNAITYACILKACGIVQDVDMGKQIHDEIVSQGLLGKNIVLSNALVDMYAKCGVFMKARKAFDELLVKDVVSWNALIAGYVQHGQGKEALGCFHWMQSKGFSPNAITYTSILKACGILQDGDMGEKIHDEIVRKGMLRKDVVLCGALVDMYAKCSVLLKAQNVFDELHVRDAASWNALIAGYARQGQSEKAMSCLQQMRREGFSPNGITYSCILKACGIMQDAHMSKQIHADNVSLALLKKGIVLGKSWLTNMPNGGVLFESSSS